MTAPSDPVASAIANQGVSDEPSSLHSAPPPHDGTGRASATSKVERYDGDDDDDDEDGPVVYDSNSTKLESMPSPSSGGSGRRGRTSSIARSSIESLSFGYQQHLLPLSLSRGPTAGAYDDDDDDDDDREAGGGRGYGEAEGSRGAAPGTSGLGASAASRRLRADVRRTSLVDGIALNVGLQIGSGIFSSPGVVTLNVGSIGASLVVWIMSGVLAWTGANSYAELGAAIPLNGGAQAYLNYSYGPLASYLFAWTAIVSLKPVSGAIIAIIFGEYIARVLYHTTSKSAGHPHEQGLEGIPQWSIKLIAILIVFFISALNAISARAGTRTQVTTTVVKLLALAAVPVFAIVHASKGNMPEGSRIAFSSLGALFQGSSSSPGNYALALYSGLWAYDGWDQSNYVAGELKNVGRDLPRIINASLGIVMAIIVATVTSYFLVLPPKLVSQTNTVALDFGAAIFGPTGGIFFALLVAFSCFGALNSHLYTSSRLIYAAGREGYLPSVFATLHPRTRTPMAAQALQTALITFFALFGSGFAALVNFYAVCSWLFYFLTVGGLLILRIKEPNLERPYQTWLPTPIIFTAVAVFLLIMPIFSAPLEALAAVIFILAGVPAYYLSQPRGREALSRIPIVSTLVEGIHFRLARFGGGGAGAGANQDLFGRRVVRRTPKKPGQASGDAEDFGEEDEEGLEEEAVEMLPRSSRDGQHRAASTDMAQAER